MKWDTIAPCGGRLYRYNRSSCSFLMTSENSSRFPPGLLFCQLIETEGSIKQLGSEPIIMDRFEKFSDMSCLLTIGSSTAFLWQQHWPTSDLKSDFLR